MKIEPIQEKNEAQVEGISPNVSRREMVKLAAGAMIVPTLPQAGSASTAKAQSYRPKFFTPAEFAIVVELSEMIIPADEHSPGAREAGAAEYIDGQLAETWDEKLQPTWRDGLKQVDRLSTEMHGKPFMQASAEQRLELLTRMAKGEEDPQKPEEQFFVELKSRVAYAYYTSKIGLRQELEYKGNTYLREFAGVDVSK